MKHLVYLLLGLNAAYFIWNQFQTPTTPPPVVVSLPPGVESLALLSERGQDPTATEPARASNETGQTTEQAFDPVLPQASTEARVTAEMLPVCRTIGPINKRAEAAVLLDQLSLQGYPGTLRESEIQAPSGYQVYLPAMSSERAQEIVDALEAAGMIDYFVGKRNHMSLGIFSDRTKALMRQRRVRELGYDAVLDVRYKTRKAHWIDIEENHKTPGVRGGWQLVMAHYPNIQTQRVSCE